MIMRLIEELGPWSWWLLGLLLLGLEILVPSTFFLWFGLSAFVVGALAFFTDFAWQVDLVIFLVLSLAALLIGRKYMAKSDDQSGDPNLNKRGSRYVGRHFVLAAPILQGEGKLSVDDTVWRITGPDLPAGTTVEVTQLDGSKLVVDAVTPQDQTAEN